ncbi:MAG: nucleotidyltransferase domain-containing protein [Nanobdellota archaeon]
MRPEDKVYGAYFSTGKHSLYFNEIKELTQLSDSSLANTLKQLTASEIVVRDKRKSNTYYRINDRKLFAIKFAEIALRRFHGLNVGVRVPLKHFLDDLSYDIYTVVLFGSAARREEKKGSDIDLLIVSDIELDLKEHKREAEISSNYPLSIFKCTIKEFIENEDDLIIQARKGFPVYKEQNFYEVMLGGYWTIVLGLKLPSKGT